MRGRYSGYSRQYNLDSTGNYLYLLVVSLLFWITGYLYSVGYPVYEEVTATPLWNAVCRALPNKFVTYLIGFLLMSGGAFLIHRMNFLLAIIREKTFLPFLLYIFLISTNLDLFPLKAASAGIFCLILATYQLFTSFHESNAVNKAFNAALFIGAGSLFWVYTLWFLPLFWIGMYNFKSLSLRTFLASLMGLIAIYWFLFGWCVIKHDFTPFTLSFSVLAKIHLFRINGAGLIDWIILAYAGFFTLIAALHIITHDHEDNLRTRQYLFFLIAFAVLSFGLFFIYEQSSAEFLSVACMPVALLLSHYFTVNKGRKRFMTYYISVTVFIILIVMRLWSSLSNTVI